MFNRMLLMTNNNTEHVSVNLLVHYIGI